jgi:hypothetical protein
MTNNSHEGRQRSPHAAIGEGVIAEVIWRFEPAEGDLVPLNAEEGAGGAGVWLYFRGGLHLGVPAGDPQADSRLGT